jgi:gluconolactonase
MKTSNASPIDRRSFLRNAATAVAGAALLPRVSPAADRDWSGQQPVRYPDADVVVLDERFGKYKVWNTPLQRLCTGMLWAEGPAWNAVGRCLVWSDIPNNRQMRWLEEDGHVSVFRSPSGYSNGNTFDATGRQITCEHLNRRVIRHEHDGSVTELADRWNGKQLNSPNDVVVHPDGAIWFTDPPWGILGPYEGSKAEPQLKDGVYRIDGRSGAVDLVTDELVRPNGLCFSPDFKKLYITDDSDTPITLYEVVDSTRLANRRPFVSLPAGDTAPKWEDGIRCDADGNIWAATGWRGEGFDGVHIFAPDSTRIGQIRLPEACANLCFGGARRNRLFMTASQSLYALYVNTQGAPLP